MEDRFIERRGVFVVKHREVYYHRIKSVYMVEPFLMRFVGLSNTYLITSDRYAMNMSLIGLTNGQLFLECLREEMNSSRIRRGVKEIDLFEF